MSEWLLERLPAGQHGLSPDLVEENQRARLAQAATAALAAQGYGGITTTEVAKRAGVSTSTFYKRFDDLWDCLLAAYELGSGRLCARIEAACAATDEGEEGASAAIDAALTLLASEPPLARLLSAGPPLQAEPLRAAHRRLTDHLAALLRKWGQRRGGGESEARLVEGALALVAMRTAAGEAEQLRELAPTLIAILLKPRSPI